MDWRLRGLAEQLDAGLIARREFLRTSAVVTGGTAAGLAVLRRMAFAQPKTKLRIWLFKSFEKTQVTPTRFSDSCSCSSCSPSTG